MKHIQLFEEFVNESIKPVEIQPALVHAGIKKVTGKDIVDYEEQLDSFKYQLVGSSKWHSISRKDLEKAIGWNESVNEAKAFDADEFKLYNDITEAKVPVNWIPFDLDYEVSKNRPLWLLMDSKLSSKDIDAIKAASPYAMKVGFFEVEIAMDKKPSIQSDPYDFSRAGGSKNAWVVTIKK